MLATPAFSTSCVTNHDFLVGWLLFPQRCPSHQSTYIVVVIAASTAGINERKRLERIVAHDIRNCCNAPDTAPGTEVSVPTRQSTPGLRARVK